MDTAPLLYPEAASFLLKMSHLSAEIRLKKDGSIEYVQEGGHQGVFYYPDDVPAWLRSWLRVEATAWRHLLQEQQPRLPLHDSASFLVCCKDEDEEEDEGSGLLCLMEFWAGHPVIRDLPGDPERWGSSGNVGIKFYYRFYPAECTFRKHG